MAEAQRWIIIKEAMADFWTIFLTPPIGNLRSYSNLVDDSRFPPDFLPGFIVIFNHSCGLPVTDDPRLAFYKEVAPWTADDDPTYEQPQSMMWSYFLDWKAKTQKKERELKKKETEELKKKEKEAIQEVVTYEQIEKTKEKKRKDIAHAQKTYEEAQRKSFAPTKFERRVVKGEAAAQNDANRYKNT